MSNFGVAQLDELAKHSSVVPAVNQVNPGTALCFRASNCQNAFDQQ